MIILLVRKPIKTLITVTYTVNIRNSYVVVLQNNFLYPSRYLLCHQVNSLLGKCIHHATLTKSFWVVRLNELSGTPFTKLPLMKLQIHTPVEPPSNALD